MKMIAPIDRAESLSDELAPLKAGERLRWLRDHYGERVVATTSFGLQSAVMLDLIAEHAPEMPVVFIDTGYLFPETYRYAEKLIERFGTNLKVFQPRYSAARMEAVFGRLWENEEGRARYSVMSKIEPMDRALRELGAEIWVSGVRRSQSSTRMDRPFAEAQKRTLKIYPILDWADAQISAHIHDRSLPPHPLAEHGYVTMGDWHSTRPAVNGLDAEDTRFNGEKYECGLHLDSGNTDFQI